MSVPQDLPPDLETLLSSGVIAPELVALIRKHVSNPQAAGGEPLPDADEEGRWMITEADIAMAQADWILSVPEEFRTLLDGNKPV